MPWQESSPMTERFSFVQACLDRAETIADICERFGISEKTGYKFLKRFRERGPDGLEYESRARLTHPHRITPEVVARIIELKRKYPHYGPGILRDRLVQQEPRQRWPATSSIGELLKRCGLTRKKRRRQSAKRAALDTSHTRAHEPNQVWTADFKGEFRLRKGAGEYCYPLTVLDLHSHFCLGCRAFATTAVATTEQGFVRLFREYGLPQVIRTDNGVPFAQANALGRLGKLAFWWVRLGIRPEHIALGRPSENGAHERFHRTLKAAATRPGSPSFTAQQKRFDDFRTEYNEKRPHSSLAGHQPPGQLYTSSSRPYPARLPALFYPDGSVAVRVDVGGSIKWRNHGVFLSSNIAGEYVGLSESGDGLFMITYGSMELGSIHCETGEFLPRVRWRG